jgi:flagellin-like protein
MNLHKRKGISPLIAAVLLVAFTMAIAGIMAAWATTFSSERLTSAQQCVFALKILDVNYKGGVVTMRLENANPTVNMTGLKGSVVYEDISNNLESLSLSSYGAKDPLGTVETTTVTIDTGNNITPKKIEVVASNCPDHKVTKEL